ncbi:MAG: hypothetical protein WCE45_08785 [Sedimentisphaerales bacterium]
MTIEYISSISTIIFSALVAFSTVIYAVLTWKLVSETIKLRKAQTEPTISIRIEPNEHCLLYCDMIIQNIGLGPAYDLKFYLDSEIKDIDGKPLSELNLIKNGIRYLAPNSKRQFFFAQFSEKSKDTMKIRDSFEIKVIYKNSQDEILDECFTIDFSEFLGLTTLGELPMYSIAKSLKAIESKIQHWKP